ncbi:MAG: hypothetical protein ACPGYV_15020, partial [Phycisphaeraceae bacterium]
MFPWFWFSILVLHAAVLVVHLWRWRRQRVRADVVARPEQHAFCASCGYDLTGKDASTIADVPVDDCPECGRAIRDKTDIIVPRLVKNKMTHKTFAAMVGLQVFLVVMMGFLFYDKYRNPSPFQASNAALIRQATQPALPGQTLANNWAYFELARRLTGNELSTSQAQQILAHALAVQADPTQPWDDQLGDIIERAREQGLTTDAQWQQYAAQPGVVQLQARQRIHPGDPVVLQLQADFTKLRASADFRSRMAPSTLRDAEVRIVSDAGLNDGKPLATHWTQLHTHRAVHFVPRRSNGKPLEPGKYRVEVETYIGHPDPLQSPKPGGSQATVRLVATFEVVPNDQPLLIPVKDPALAKQIQNDLRAELLRSGGTQIKQAQWGRYLSFSLKEPSAPVAGSFAVTSPIDGHLNQAIFIFEHNIRGNTWNQLTIPLDAYQPPKTANPDRPFDTFTLRLTPNPDRLKRRLTGY